MADIAEQLRRYADALEHAVHEPEVAQIDSAAGQRRNGRMLAVAATIAAAVIGAVLFVRVNDDPAGVITTPASPMLFASPTDVVLLFSDGIDGATAIDPDRMLAGRRVIEGERAGDQTFRLTLVDDQLVVGWGEIYAAPLDGGPSNKIADATIYVPAAEPRQVWTFTWAGGRIGGGEVTLRRVDLAGRTTYETKNFDAQRYEPLLGVPGGLAVRTPTGIAVWDAETESVGSDVGSGPVTSVSSDGRHLAWCDETCATTHVERLPRTGPTTPPFAAVGRAAALAPDGSALAVLRPVPGAGTQLVLIDTTTGSEHAVPGSTMPATDVPRSVLWAPDSSQVFVATDSYGASGTEIGRYVPRSDRWQVTHVDVGGLLSGIVVTPAQARSFFGDTVVDKQHCPSAGSSYPSGRAGVCTFSIGPTTDSEPAVTSFTMGLGEHASEARATFEAADPRVNTLTVTVTPSRSDLTFKLDFMTSTGATLHVLDAARIADSCRVDDDKMTCRVLFPILEAELPGEWNAIASKVDGDDLELEVSIEWKRAS